MGKHSSFLTINCIEISFKRYHLRLLSRLKFLIIYYEIRWPNLGIYERIEISSDGSDNKKILVRCYSSDSHRNGHFTINNKLDVDISAKRGEVFSLSILAISEYS
ncbi:unnamed protein product [Moneuplotes crassus]|uniref:Uncharacterized protein n=1 Tax=Euplotes crassus TaxID=5936 RepID=A0AAD2DBF2_EUPCR|nr:unnamed protein product [Moneuplotes crassus]